MKAATIAFAAAPPLARPALGQGALNDGEASINFLKLATAIALMACAGIAHAQQTQEVIRDSVHKVAEKPSNIVNTRAEPQQLGRDSIYATQPPNPGNPVLAGGLTVDEAGGAPLYAVQLTHPSGPVMEAEDDLQPYGRDSVYTAGSTAHIRLSRLAMAHRG
jgi:hypothetical protein